MCAQLALKCILQLPIYHCFSTPLSCLHVCPSWPFLLPPSAFCLHVLFLMNLDPLFSLVHLNVFFIHLTYAASCLHFTSCTFLFLQLFPWAYCSLWSPLSVSLTGWASWELRLTFQLHFDLWPCCCRLLHLGHNSTCHSLTFHPLCSASYPAITTLPFFSSPSPLSATYQGYGGYSGGKHTPYIQCRDGRRGKQRESYSQVKLWSPASVKNVNWNVYGSQ